MTTTPTIVLYILLLKYNKNLDDDAWQDEKKGYTFIKKIYDF
jgi:hypothetical protein